MATDFYTVERLHNGCYSLYERVDNIVILWRKTWRNCWMRARPRLVTLAS